MLNTGVTGMASLKRGLRRGMQQITRDRAWATTLLLLTALLVLVQMFIVFLLGVHGVSRMLTARAGIQLEVLPSAGEADIQELYAALRTHSTVLSVAYVPRDQAYESQKARDPELVAFLEEYGLENPFPDTFSVTLKSLDDYDAFVAEVQKDQWRSVVNPSFLTSVSDRENEIRSLMQVTNGLQTLSAVFIVIAFILLFFAVVEWVSRTASNRGHELTLEHLLGAPSLAVLLPFTAEVTILLLLGTLGATAIVTAGFFMLPFLMPALALEAPFRQLQSELLPLLLTVFPILLIIELLAMPLLAFGGTFMTVRKRLPKSFTLFS